MRARDALQSICLIASLATSVGWSEGPVRRNSCPPDPRGQVFVEFDGGSCSQSLTVYEGGCIVGGGCETRLHDGRVESSDFFGQAFVECNERADVCGAPFVCVCCLDGGVIGPPPSAKATSNAPAPRAESGTQKELKRLAIPAPLRRPLAIALPSAVHMTSFAQKGGVATLGGTAEGFDDVSEFLRGLNNLVACPRGLARVVERKRDSSFRVELIDGGRIVECTSLDVRFVFPDLEVRSAGSDDVPAEVVEKEVKFTLTFRIVQ